MKKIFLALALCVTLGAVLSSCKSHEKCPAYGYNQIEQPDKTA